MLWTVLTGARPARRMTIVPRISQMSLGWSLLSSAMIVAATAAPGSADHLAPRSAAAGCAPGRSVLLVLAPTAWTCQRDLRPLVPLFGAAVAIDLATALLSCRVAGLLEEIDGAGSTDG